MVREENLDTRLYFFITRDTNECFGAESTEMIMMYTLEVLVMDVKKVSSLVQQHNKPIHPHQAHFPSPLPLEVMPSTSITPKEHTPLP